MTTNKQNSNAMISRLPGIFKISIRLVLILLGATAVARADVTDVNPDGDPLEPRFGGRSLGITVHPTDTTIVFVANRARRLFFQHGRRDELDPH